MSVAESLNVNRSGQGAVSLVFSHGFGCDQNMWRFVAPRFAADYQIVLYDNMGAGNSQLDLYDFNKYASIEGYASDVLALIDELGLANVVFIGHSVSAITGVLAAIRDPSKFNGLVLVAPSPCYIDQDGYIGGFTREAIHGLLDLLDSNHLGWSQSMGPAIMGNPERPELGAELTNSFCRTDPVIARHMARTTFLSDHRSALPKLSVPSVILQCRRDVIAPEAVGEYMRRAMPGSQLVLLDATGHCPNLSAPEETANAIEAFLSRPDVMARRSHG